MGNNPSKFQQGDDYPVEMVSWDDVQAFIERLNAKTGGRYGFTLPSEAQWEYACRSGGKDEKYAGSQSVDQVAWYSGNSGNSGNSGKKTHPVGRKQPNGLGLYDLSGNVLEWVQDNYKGDIYGIYAKEGTVENPIYEAGGSGRVFRGGAWGYDASGARCAYRDYWHPGVRYRDLGFRLLRSK